MKIYSLIILSTLLISSVLTSCNPNNPQPNTSSWKFKVSINGVSHRAESNTFDINSNYCVATTSSSWTFHSRIIDKTAASYISGDNGELLITIENPSLGINQLSNCVVLGSWFTDVTAVNFFGGYSLTQNGPMVPNSTGGLGPRLPINLTSLGTAGNGQYANSQPVKGNYTGTIYFQSSIFPNTGFDIPVTLDIEFEAIRP